MPFIVTNKSHVMCYDQKLAAAGGIMKRKERSLSNNWNLSKPWELPVKKKKQRNRESMTDREMGERRLGYVSTNSQDKINSNYYINGYPKTWHCHNHAMTIVIKLKQSLWMFAAFVIKCPLVNYVQGLESTPAKWWISAVAGNTVNPT